MPAGLRSLGSAESLQKEAEELKKLRKAGKGGFASQVRSKTKQVEDKIKELDDIQSKLAEKPPHLLLGSYIYIYIYIYIYSCPVQPLPYPNLCPRSEPLRNGYHDELELHRASLQEALQKLQAFNLGSRVPVFLRLNLETRNRNPKPNTSTPSGS